MEIATRKPVSGLSHYQLNGRKNKTENHKRKGYRRPNIQLKREAVSEVTLYERDILHNNGPPGNESAKIRRNNQQSHENFGIEDDQGITVIDHSYDMERIYKRFILFGKSPKSYCD